MNTLAVLENKITALIEKIKELQVDKVRLEKENVRLSSEFKALEERVLKGTISINELSQEKETTKLVVDDLIKNIDLLIENGK